MTRFSLHHALSLHRKSLRLNRLARSRRRGGRMASRAAILLLFAASSALATAPSTINDSGAPRSWSTGIPVSKFTTVHPVTMNAYTRILLPGTGWSGKGPPMPDEEPTRVGRYCLRVLRCLPPPGPRLHRRVRDLRPLPPIKLTRAEAGTPPQNGPVGVWRNGAD